MINWKTELEKINRARWPIPDPLRRLSSNGIVLYGAGEMGKMALDYMRIYNLEPLYFVDRNKSGQLDGVNILHPLDIALKDKQLCTFIICIVTISTNQIKNFLVEQGCQDVRHFYDFSEIIFPEAMPNGWFVQDYHINELKKVLSWLEHDEYSVAHYLQFLWWRLKRKEVIYPGFPILSGKKYFGVTCMENLSKNERLIDGGAYHGQAIESFLKKVEIENSKIWAFEPDQYNMKVLKQKYSTKNIILYDEALSNKCQFDNFYDELGYASKINAHGLKQIKSVAIDSLKRLNPTIIKLHIEGGELNALQGAEKTINKYRPSILVLADHNKDGLFKIARYLKRFNEYELYFYLHDYCGNSAVYYAIPRVTQER